MTDLVNTRIVHDPFLNKDVEIKDRLTDRLRGRYACGPIMANGEPEFGYREFETPPVQHEAASALESLTAENAAVKAERDDALDRVEELELQGEVISDEFEKDCWKAMRRLLEVCHFNWRDVDPGEGVSAEWAYEHIKESIDGLELAWKRAEQQSATLLQQRNEAFERAASYLAESYPDNANTNAFCAAIRSLKGQA